MADLDKTKQAIDQIYKNLDQIKEYTCSPSKILVYGDNAYLLAGKVKDDILSLEGLSARSTKILGCFDIVKKDDDNISLDNYAFRLAKSIMDDIKFKLFCKSDPEYDQILKIIVARERDVGFELWLAGMINGSEKDFIEHKDLYLFFYSLGFNEPLLKNIKSKSKCQSDNEIVLNTIDLQNYLASLCSKDIYFILLHGILKADIFAYYKKSREVAVNYFRDFINNSINNYVKPDISNALGININSDLLSNIKAETSDKELNDFINSAIKRYRENDKEAALNDLWKAFERLKTYCNGKDKKESAENLVNKLSENFRLDFVALDLDKSLSGTSINFMNTEFNILTKIGNNCHIRHAEPTNIKLTEEYQDYFFFRLLSLIDLCLKTIQKNSDLQG